MSLLVLAPHPDDEVLGCARLMVHAQARGEVVAIAWLTDGGGSHGDLPPASRAALVARRRSEALAGLAALGLRPVATRFLGLPDGALAHHADAARQEVAVFAAACGARTLVVTDRDDGHPDHRAACALADRIAVPRRYSYPVSGRYDGQDTTPPPGARVIPPRPGERKRAALLCHASQMAEDALYPLTLATIERFCAAPEVFLPWPGDSR